VIQRIRTAHLPLSSVITALAWALAVVGLVLVSMTLPEGTMPTHADGSSQHTTR
jgi:hypothetical protein